MKKIITLCLVLVLCGCSATVFAAATKKKPTVQPFEKLFYYVPGEGSFVTFQQYAKNVDIFAPQVYKMSAVGKLSGSISDKALSIVTANKIKVMPLVFNEDFDPDVMHTILLSDALQDSIITQLVDEAHAKNYSGWQFDIEHVMATDRDRYSTFVEKTAKRLHTEKLLLSVAVIARTSEKPSDLPEGSWDHWAGVFDYKRIGKAADFVSLMAYDEPASKGPVASLPWVKKTLTYLEKSVPKSKISLGIPTYGWIWDLDTNTRVRSIGHDKITELEVNNLYIEKGYDKKTETAWITYNKVVDGVTHHYKIWYEDVRSWKTKLALAKSHKIRGVSVWVIGMEDETIWKNMK